MVYRRRSSGNSIRPVHRIKHVIDNQGATAAAGVATFDLMAAVDAPVLANPTEVETGSKVNGFYLKVEAYATSSAALSNFYMIVFKNPGGNLTIPAANAVGVSDNKRFVIHQEMVMLQKEQSGELGGNPRVVFNGVIVIPRGYRRFAPNDLLTLRFLTPGISSELCLQCHYKEFR